MWGQVFQDFRSDQQEGIIPTRVGTRDSVYYQYGVYKDHPHACGDKFNQMCGGQGYDGSSPRVWGQVIDKIGKLEKLGIIPTRVGTSCYNKLCPHCVGDHPHACGDKLFLGYHRLCCHGSSPRVWGQGQIINNFITKIRIIPTRVGTSLLLSQRIRGFRDHPHACGDKFDMRFPQAFALGSSPRVWGQVKLLSLSMPLARIIPTRVGTSHSQYSCCHRPKDHPHACGDKRIKGGAVSEILGSSPRVWGQETTPFLCLHDGRIIPTRVGTSKRSYQRNARNEDHPHACGDKFLT